MISNLKVSGRIILQQIAANFSAYFSNEEFAGFCRKARWVLPDIAGMCRKVLKMRGIVQLYWKGEFAGVLPEGTPDFAARHAGFCRISPRHDTFEIDIT